ncbi:MAG: nuclear transport factor 2 family protein [bacterium]|nr:nuclear transport factor 2 family protein [bacterium]
MENTKMLVEDLASMIGEGKILEAFEKYYADDVVMQENEDAPRVGKDASRAYEEAFVNGITEFHGGKTLGVAVGDNYSTIESFMDVTHKDYGRIARTQVAVQHWKDGKVVKEKFYYNTK